MKTETIVVVDRNGDEHAFAEDDEHSYWAEYKDDTLVISTNANDGMPADAFATFFEPRYMKTFWE